MSSGCTRISQQNYYSTHNALVANVDDQSVRFVLHELEGTRHGALRIFPFYDIQMIKRLLIKKLSLPLTTRVKDLRILYKGQELPNYRTMDCYINNSKRDDKLYWCLKQSPTGSGIRPLGMKMNSKMQDLFNEIAISMKNNIKPKLTLDGTGGTYEIHNKNGKCVGIFKPCDEEAFTPYNPRGYTGTMNQQGFRPGVLSGEGATREVAAYLLDSTYKNFSNVPTTIMVEIAHQSLNNCNTNNLTNNYLAFNSNALTDSSHINSYGSLGSYGGGTMGSRLKWKIGSLQEFVVSRGTSGNYNYNFFSVEDVHKIAILDIRLLNLDRNDCNILVTNVPQSTGETNPYGNMPYGESVSDGRYQVNGDGAENCSPNHQKIKDEKYKLVPIDHGLILPDIIDICDLDWVWYEWPQCKVPFSAQELDLIFSFNVDKDIELLRKYLHIREECLRTIKVTTKFLQIAASMNLNLYQIATIIVRHDIDIPSEIEIIIKKAIEQAYKMSDNTSIISRNRLGNIIDLMENSLNPILSAKDQSENPAIQPNDTEDELSPVDLDLSELPSSTFFHYPTYTESTSERDKVRTHSRSTIRRIKRSTVTNNTWSITDSGGHAILIEWDYKFNNLFFKILEEMLVGNIQRLHPNWASYPFNGNKKHLYQKNQQNNTLPFKTIWFN
uniref:Phosphatidylinositol 3- and 4-kinase, putative n=1 Tax=Theileria annulata TaxID=5874 RepID=A0A3B0NDV7_THEAN